MAALFAAGTARVPHQPCLDDVVAAMTTVLLTVLAARCCHRLHTTNENDQL
jgi:hypothetical protein